MAFFKSEEEKQKEHEERIKRNEERILKFKEYMGKVGHVHQGMSYAGLWGVRDNGKMKFKSTKFEIHDTKLLIERNKMIIDYSNIKEIFNETKNEAIIILESGDGIPVKSSSNAEMNLEKFAAFLNILNRLIEKNKSNGPTSESNVNISTEDKFDKLIKLGEMHEKGLLSEDEFKMLKEELMTGTKEETPAPSENIVDSSENICNNCGAEISPDDAFCSECGTKND